MSYDHPQNVSHGDQAHGRAVPRRWWCGVLLFLCGLTGAHAVEASTSVVMMIAEEEYGTATSLPAFAAKDLAPLGVHCTTVLAEPADGHDFPGLLTALPGADLLLISVRRRAPTTAQMTLIRQHLDAGKAVVGIRTASHAFGSKTTPAGHVAWPEFDREVLGGSYTGHYGNEAAVLIAATGAADAKSATHPLLAGVDLATLTTSRLYKNATLVAGAVPLVLGCSGTSDQSHHVAWTNQVGKSRIFYTSLGAEADFVQPAFRRLLSNGLLWALRREPAVDAAVPKAATP